MKEDQLTYLAIAYMEMLEGSTMLLKLLETEASEAVMHLKRERAEAADEPSADAPESVEAADDGRYLCERASGLRFRLV